MTKNTLFLTALFAFSSIVNANDLQVAQSAKIFTFQYSVQPKNNDFTDWNNANASLIELANRVQTKSTGTTFYQSVLIFIKEMQEAIAAGLNLFGSISTSQESFSEIIQDITQAAIEDNVKDSAITDLGNTKSTDEEAVTTEETVSADVVTTDAVATEVVVEEVLVEEILVEEVQAIPSITVSLSLLATDESEQATWTAAKEMLEAFSQQATAGDLSPEDFVGKLTAIFEFIDQSPIRGSLQISSKPA
ncbi:MAG: hypothetical protein WC747_00070 [Candidatus Babeliales bacterium]|jgi:hypothetical protein